MKISALCLLLVAASQPVLTTGARTALLMRFRGGGDDDAIEEQLKRQGNVGKLCRDEIVEKLNSVPLFCIMQDDGSVISLPDSESAGEECCTWFVDAFEAQATLKKVVTANPDLSGLKLARHGLGDFVLMSNGWPQKHAMPGGGPRLKLKAAREVVSTIGSQLVSALQQAGLDPGLWQMAVFLAEELAQATPDGDQTVLPVFIHPADVQAAYSKAGIPADALSRVKVLELRQLLQMMLDETPDAVNPWRAVRFLPSPAAIELAQKLES